MAVTEIKVDAPGAEKSQPLPVEDAFIVAVALHHGYHRENWLDDRPLLPEAPQSSGTTTFIDLRRLNHTRFKSSIHTVQFYFSRSALKSIASIEGGECPRDLTTDVAIGQQDFVYHRLALSLLPAFERPEEVTPLFLDHVMMAGAARLMCDYTASKFPVSGPVRGGLAPWQSRRAMELLSEHLDGSVALADIANECGLSLRHFSRAFAQSTGLPPHRWLLRQRVDRAKELLRSKETALGEIAVLAGFADQSHFTRVFTQLTGMSPGAWRRKT